jgi:hypothetical protein
MRKRTALTRTTLLVALACLPLLTPCHARQSEPAARRGDEAAAARVSLADAAGLLEKIRAVESPTSRAYLYSRVADWLGRHAGEDPAVRRAAVDAAADAVADLHQHEREIPPAPSHMLYQKLLGVVSKHDPAKAEELKRAFPLRREAELTDADKSGRAFYTAIVKLNNPETAAQGVELAERLISSGSVPPYVLQGEFLRLDMSKSPALPRLLAATLALEEQRPGALPLVTMFFLSQLYLKEGAPAPLQTRFLAAALKATRISPADLKADLPRYSWAVPLLRQALPVMRKLTPELHGEAVARLAALAPGAPAEDAAYERVRKSSDPLGQLMAEADAARDERRKSELLESAAREARRQGKLRLAVELTAAAESARPAPPEGDRPREELLAGVVRDALARKDLETAGLAASNLKSRVNRAEALRPIAFYQLKSDDPQSAVRTLTEAEKILERAPAGIEQAMAYLHLAADFAALDPARAAGALREAVKVANRLSRPREVAEADFSWKLLPLADATITTFQSFARADRDAALSLADTFDPKELKAAATLGVYSR